MSPHADSARAGRRRGRARRLPAGTAAAHIQVRPAVAAPGRSRPLDRADPVRGGGRARGRSSSRCRRTCCRSPTRTSPAGRARSSPTPTARSARSCGAGDTLGDGLATFRFLASTPEREGPIAWKAIQTYRDGDIVRWIGSPGSETPASVTTISQLGAARERRRRERGARRPARRRPRPASPGPRRHRGRRHRLDRARPGPRGAARGRDGGSEHPAQAAAAGRAGLSRAS